MRNFLQGVKLLEYRAEVNQVPFTKILVGLSTAFRDKMIYKVNRYKSDLKLAYNLLLASTSNPSKSPGTTKYELSEGNLHFPVLLIIYIGWLS